MKTKRFDAALILILLAAAFLNTYHIWQDDTANQYYLAAVKSMTQSFHNFFYASFDPSGFVTVDKPPVVLWIQTIFALIFGVHTWSVIIPQGSCRSWICLPSLQNDQADFWNWSGPHFRTCYGTDPYRSSCQPDKQY